MMITAVVQAFYPQREPNLGPILDAIEAVSDIVKTIIWINGPAYRMRFPRPNVETIQSSFDTLIGQYAAAFLASTPLIYCQNDDLVVSPETIYRMRDEAIRLESFVSLSGAILNRQSSRPYSDSRDHDSGPCDVMQGRAWMAQKRVLVSGMSRCLEMNVNPNRGEDLFFSFGRAYVLANGQFINIDENGVGLRFDEGHLEERDHWAAQLLASEAQP